MSIYLDEDGFENDESLDEHREKTLDEILEEEFGEWEI